MKIKGSYRLRAVKRGTLTRKRTLTVRIFAGILALAVIAGLLLIMKYSPLAVFGDIFYGAFGKKILIEETVKNTIPLLTCSLGLSLAFRTKIWNIGGEGQILVGGIAATAVSFSLSGLLPSGVLLMVMAIAAVLAAGLYGIFPAFCKAKWRSSETLLTLMLNYVALQMVVLLQNTKSWQDSYNAYPQIRMLDSSSRLPKVGGVHIGWILALLLLVAVEIYVKKTRHGFEMKVLGDSRSTAAYAGIPVLKVMIRTMFLSAGLCGLTGFLQVSGADGTLSEATSGGIGFSAIAVAWMAHLHPAGMLGMSLFLAVLERGADRLQTVYLIPASFSEVMKGILLLFMMGCEFFVRYQVKRKKGENSYDN